jgi:hypothetical protein
VEPRRKQVRLPKATEILRPGKPLPPLYSPLL